MGEAIEAYAPTSRRIQRRDQRAVISGAVNLADYDAVIWIQRRGIDRQRHVQRHRADGDHELLGIAGRKLFVCGAEIGWDLDAQGGGASFYNNQLKADYVADDANSYNAHRAGGGIFAGLSFTFDNGAQFYNVEFPDVIAPFGGSTAALTYSTGGDGRHPVHGSGATVADRHASASRSRRSPPPPIGRP